MAAELSLREVAPTQQLRAPFFSLPFSSQCKEKLGDPLPPQYALELLTIYAWERGGRLTKFNTAQGFRTVLELITKYKQLLIYWTVCYDFQHPEVSKYLRRQLKKPRYSVPTWHCSPSVPGCSCVKGGSGSSVSME